MRAQADAKCQHDYTQGRSGTWWCLNCKKSEAEIKAEGVLPWSLALDFTKVRLMAEEWPLVRELYAETYPVRSLLNHVDELAVALRELRRQIREFTEKHDEADFYTGDADRILKDLP